MKKTTRIFSLLTAILMLLSAAALVSCGESTDPGEITTGPAVVQTDPIPEETTEPEIRSAVLPADLKFQDEEITLISRNEPGINDEFLVNELSGSLIVDSVYKRNLQVEEDLGIKFNMVLSDGNGAYVISDAARNYYKTGEHVWDIIVNSTYSTIKYCSEGYLRNLLDCTYLDLKAPYWSQGFNEVASIGNAQYMATGPITLSTFRFMFVTFFNAKMFADTNHESLYDVVNDGRWTLDYQIQLADEFYSDTNGSLSADEGDTFGFSSNTLSYLDPYLSSCKNPIITKTSDNWYEYSMDADRVNATNEKLIELFWNHNAFIGTDGGDSGFQARMTKVFSEDRSATCTMRLVAVETDDLRNMNSEYGIVPMPKLNEDQLEYGSFLHDQFNSVGIVSTVTDESRFQMLGAVIEDLAVRSYNITVPNYYEIALKGRYLRDSRSWEMLDLCYNSISIDAGVLFNDKLNTCYTIVRTIVASKNNTTSSTAKANAKAVPKALDKLMDEYRALQK